MTTSVDTTGRPMPQLAGVTHGFLDLPGLRMHVAEAGAGEPVLLLHGFPQHWWEWRGAMPRLAREFHVLAPDLRGAGWTEAPPDGYATDQLVADLVSLVERLDLGAVHVVAHDWSALVGFRLCFERPDLVRTFLSLGVTHPWPRLDVRLLGVLHHTWFEPLLATPGIGSRALGGRRQWLTRHLLGLASPSAMDDADRETFLAALREPERARAATALYRHGILPEARRVFRGAYRGRRLTTPTAVVIGSRDTVLRPWILDGYQAHADALTAHVVEGATHFVVDDRPDEVLRIFAQLAR